MNKKFDLTEEETGFMQYLFDLQEKARGQIEAVKLAKVEGAVKTICLNALDNSGLICQEKDKISLTNKAINALGLVTNRLYPLPVLNPNK